MGLRTVFKTAGHWFKGLIVKVDSEIQFDQTSNPEIDSTGGDFIWKTRDASANSWKLNDPVTAEDIIIVDTASKSVSINSNYSTQGISNVVISATPPSDTTKLWFNTLDDLVYFYNGTYWLSSKVYSTTFNEPGSTPNNAWFRIGNTVTSLNGIGEYLEFDAYLEKLTYKRNPGTSKIGNYWLYSNSVTGTETASVVATFSVPVDSGGQSVIDPSTPVIINAGSYISLRWNGLQTNNNICVLKYRKKHT